MRFAVVARHLTPTNVALAEHSPAGADGTVFAPEDALAILRADDVALARIDVAPTLDGAEPGLEVLFELEHRGVRVLNRSEALLTAHDKLLTARALEGHGLPHPRTQWVPSPAETLELTPPLVLKPRFGSWGRDVELCTTAPRAMRAMAALSSRGWFHADGVLVQELVPIAGFDLRIVVAGGQVVGAVERVAAPGEWRTNIALGGHRRRVLSVPSDAATLAVGATAALGLDLAGVDLLPRDRGWVVLEVNGAVEFTDDYALNGESPFAAAAAALFPATPALAAAQ